MNPQDPWRAHLCSPECLSGAMERTAAIHKEDSAGTDAQQVRFTSHLIHEPPFFIAFSHFHCLADVLQTQLVQ